MNSFKRKISYTNIKSPWIVFTLPNAFYKKVTFPRQLDLPPLRNDTLYQLEVFFFQGRTSSHNKNV
ncbi:hypothetical protein CVS40_11930 [Lucilia cuprina]|nr:hypothetical protein CVS40_11930 [Lucilia cuprina]